MDGAVDFVVKPAANTDIRTIIADLTTKIKTVGRVQGVTLPQKQKNTPNYHVPSKPKNMAKTEGMCPMSLGDPIIVIGSSTGGPAALQAILTNLPANLPAPIVVVQHIPPGFTQSLAQRLNEVSPLLVQEAKTGDRLARGTALVAPGDYHLQFKEGHQIVLDQRIRRHHVYPSIDVTMESAAKYFGPAVIGLVLSGMDGDGVAGARAIRAAAGKIIAEHESTCVLYGMPRTVIEANLANLVVPLPHVASTLVEMVYENERVEV